MAQGRWERAFWAAARSSDFKPYPPEHWKKDIEKKSQKKKIAKKGRKQPKDAFFVEQGGQLSFFI